MTLARIFTAFFLCPFVYIAQTSAQINFFVEDAEWYYAFKTPGLIQSRGYTKYAYVRDSMIESREVHIVERTTYIVDYDDPTIPLDTFSFNPVYLTQQGDSILYYNYDDEDFQILWRTNPQAGDFFQFDRNDFQVYTMHIDSVTPGIVDGHDVMQIWLDGDLTYSWGDDELIYDRFGPVHGFFYYACWGSYDCYNSHLCKYVSAESGEVRFNGSYCDNIYTGISDIAHSSSLHIYPNPTPGIFHVELEKEPVASTQLEIYTLAGTLVHEDIIHSSKTEIDLSEKGAGVYVCKVSSATEVWVTKIILGNL